jgi:translation initiation factor 2 subunit 2
MDDEEFDYDGLLQTAYESLPETVKSGERFEIPKVDVINEGKTTIIRNFIDICEKIRRDPKDVLKFLLKELGTAGDIEGRRAIFKSKISEASIQSRFNSYVETYVICSECGRPDTELIRVDRVLMLKCEACGAIRPVTVRKSSAQSKPKAAIVEGGTYEVTIQSVGRRGDGIARVDKFVIYIKGASKKGSRVRVKIDKINGTNAFGHAVP